MKCLDIFLTKRSIISSMFLMLLFVGAVAQVTEVFDIISTTGSIIDKRTGQPLQVGDKVRFDTELEFSSLQDRAVLLNSDKAKYFLEVPKENFINSQLTVASNQALTAVKGRPAPITGTRGNSVLVTNGLSPKSLKEYFSVDTFTVIGSKFILPVTQKDAKKFELVLRYEIGNKVETYISSDLSISKSSLNMQGSYIPECYVSLRDGDKETPVTQLSLFFVEKDELFREFNSLLKALDINKKQKQNNAVVRETLRQYCTDVYGVIDSKVLESIINDFISL